MLGGGRFGDREEQRALRLGLRTVGDVEAACDPTGGEIGSQRGGGSGPRTRNSWNQGPRSGTS